VITKSLRPILCVAAALLMAACSAPSPRQAQPAADPTKEPKYARTVEQLTEIARNARAAFEAGKPDEAAALIQKGQPLMSQLLEAGQPTYGAMKAAADLDDLYARMLLSNRHYGPARLLFQKNVARWKMWPEQTDETAKLRKQAQDGIAECDRKMMQ
jgi:hypothetical protein